MKVDFSKKIESQGFVFDPQTRQRAAANQEVEIRKVVLDSTAQTRDFKEALKVKSLREKAKSEENEVDLSPEEFQILIGIYHSRPTDEKLALIDVLQEINEGFDISVL